MLPFESLELSLLLSLSDFLSSFLVSDEDDKAPLSLTLQTPILVSPSSELKPIILSILSQIYLSAPSPPVSSSFPGPPSSSSFPGPPSSSSSPSSPFNVSYPWSPFNRSLPILPLIRSFPPPPNISSLPSPPLILSLLTVPSIMTSTFMVP